MKCMHLFKKYSYRDIFIEKYIKGNILALLIFILIKNKFLINY